MIEGKRYRPIELPTDKEGKADILSSLRNEIILFRDFRRPYYRTALLEDSDSEVYWVRWSDGVDKRGVSSYRFNIHDLTGLMVQDD